MSNFIDALAEGTNKTYTENDAVTNLSSLDAVLDFFGLAGAMRGNVGEAVKLFRKAYATDKVLAIKALFYLRDVRGGQGERDVFAECMQELSKKDMPVFKALLLFVAEYGSWKDFIRLAELDFEHATHMIGTQLKADSEALEQGSSISLLAKWLPSVKTSSKQSRVLAAKFASTLKLKPREYRKLVAKLRAHIKLLEHDMSANRWEDIDFSKLPSQAFRKHTKAFQRHTPDKYKEFTEAVVKGEKTLNTSTLYPYEVYEKRYEDESAANAMWASLPDYTNGTNALVVADVSGSMEGRPMATSVSLALYFAERNKGIFNGYFMSFSAQPRLHKVIGTTLTDKMDNIENTDWDQNTNIAAAFEAILKAAQSGNAARDEMPTTLYVISDMEFDEATRGSGKTNYQYAKDLYEAAGYTLPHVVFWNVEARNSQLAATKDDKNVTLISGSSASAFKFVFEGKTPLESMIEVLNSDRYKPLEKAVL